MIKTRRPDYDEFYVDDVDGNFSPYYDLLLFKGNEK